METSHVISIVLFIVQIILSLVIYIGKQELKALTKSIENMSKLIAKDEKIRDLELEKEITKKFTDRFHCIDTRVISHDKAIAAIQQNLKLKEI